MKKQEIIGMLYWLIAFGGYVAYFFLVIQPFYGDGYSGFSADGWFAYFFLFILTIVIGVILTGIFIELFHMLGAKIGGYKITSVNIFGFNFYKDDGKIRFHFAKFDGLTGETKIVPIQGRKKEPNPNWYFFSYSIFFVIEFAALYFLFFLLKDHEQVVLRNIAHACLTIGLTSMVIWLYNLLPIQMDNKTDGYRFSLSKGKEKRKEFNKLLIIENGGSVVQEQVGEETAEVDNQPKGDSIDSIYAHLSLNQNKEALEMIERLMDDKKYIKSRDMFKCLRFYLLVIDKPLDEGKAIYDEEFSLDDRRNISQDNGLPEIEAYVLMSGLFDKSRSECDRTLQKVVKAYKHVASNKKEIEKKLVNNAIDKVLGFHPNWDLEKYKIKDE